MKKNLGIIAKILVIAGISIYLATVAICYQISTTIRDTVVTQLELFNSKAEIVNIGEIKTTVNIPFDLTPGFIIHGSKFDIDIPDLSVYSLENYSGSIKKIKLSTQNDNDIFVTTDLSVSYLDFLTTGENTIKLKINNKKFNIVEEAQSYDTRIEFNKAYGYDANEGILSLFSKNKLKEINDLEFQKVFKSFISITKSSKIFSLDKTDLIATSDKSVIGFTIEDIKNVLRNIDVLIKFKEKFDEAKVARNVNLSFLNIFNELTPMSENIRIESHNTKYYPGVLRFERNLLNLTDFQVSLKELQQLGVSNNIFFLSFGVDKDKNLYLRIPKYINSNDLYSEELSAELQYKHMSDISFKINTDTKHTHRYQSYVKDEIKKIYDLFIEVKVEDFEKHLKDNRYKLGTSYSLLRDVTETNAEKFSIYKKLVEKYSLEEIISLIPDFSKSTNIKFNIGGSINMQNAFNLGSINETNTKKEIAKAYIEFFTKENEYIKANLETKDNSTNNESPRTETILNISVKGLESYLDYSLNMLNKYYVALEKSGMNNSFLHETITLNEEILNSETDNTKEFITSLFSDGKIKGEKVLNMLLNNKAYLNITNKTSEEFKAIIEKYIVPIVIEPAPSLEANENSTLKKNAEYTEVVKGFNYKLVAWSRQIIKHEEIYNSLNKTNKEYINRLATLYSDNKEVEELTLNYINMTITEENIESYFRECSNFAKLYSAIGSDKLDKETLEVLNYIKSIYTEKEVLMHLDNNEKLLSKEKENEKQ